MTTYVDEQSGRWSQSGNILLGVGTVDRRAAEKLLQFNSKMHADDLHVEDILLMPIQPDDSER